jgi:hypothetical protein
MLDFLLAVRTDLTDEAIAGRIIELAKPGERNPNVLCEAASELHSRREISGSPPPVLFRLTADGRGFRVFHLEPIARAA